MLLRIEAQDFELFLLPVYKMAHDFFSWNGLLLPSPLNKGSSCLAFSHWSIKLIANYDKTIMACNLAIFKLYSLATTLTFIRLTPT